jgi:para-nitrobenzyl esterase
MFRTWTRWRASARLAVAGVTLAALVGAAPAVSAGVLGGQAADSAGGPVADTANGAVRGLANGAVDEFLGIPYAAPPVGALRWQPPQPAAGWSGVRDATRFAPHCPQPASPFGRASTSEDCLFLNVFTPSHHKRHHESGAGNPVMVWIHGGALVTGASEDYDPTALAADGVTVVTINYRLGALGFLAHPALADADGQSGDYGLMDQRAALRWVRRNIASFGGNPHNVTVFGESAGGLSTLSQVASPQAKGLFERAIVESGSYDLTQAPLATAEAAGEAFAAKAGCASQTAACLRSLPVSTILDNENTQGYTPNINSEVLPESLRTAFATGDFNRVPIINGTNHDEWRLFVAISELEGNPVTAANYQSMISSTLGVPAAVAAVIAVEYPLSAFPSPPVALGAVGTDAIFACPALTIDQSVSRFAATYAYEFNDENAPEDFLPPVSFPYGAAHASEIQYLMGLPGAVFPGMFSAQQQQLATIMKGYWTHFAKRGFPSSFRTPFWPRFNNLTQKTQSLVPPVPQTETDFATTHNCAFWTALEAG